MARHKAQMSDTHIQIYFLRREDLEGFYFAEWYFGEENNLWQSLEQGPNFFTKLRKYPHNHTPSVLLPFYPPAALLLPNVCVFILWAGLAAWLRGVLR